MEENGYNPHAIEPKWQRIWEETGLYRTDLDAAQRPFYNLMEFPYPSGEGLHVGHFYSYSGADSYGRFKRMHGLDVFEPMGFDAFGIHAENYALKLGVNPAQLIPRNVRRFREEQLKRVGTMFDWSREVNTTHPDYYRWTQWIFLQLYHAGLAYRAAAPVNWCPSCLTTLADEQVTDGRCERCDTPVAQRELTQWFFRITDYAERLLDFSHADFTETTQRLQTHWIGRREGAEVHFPVEGGDERITVFSTRPDTLFGATFLVLAPEHEAALTLATPEQRGAVAAYREQTQARSDVERLSVTQAKTGVWTGRYAINPVDGRRLPIWVADYVLVGFGTGAIFATPTHDQRDYDFARAHDLPILPVIEPTEEGADWSPEAFDAAYEGDGVLIHSGPYDGLTVEEGKRAIVEDLQARGLARRAVTYRLRDWLISRQRYWGPPIPIIYCERCGMVPVPEDALPVRLPATEAFRPLGTGQSPLASIDEFVHTTCPTCGHSARRETDVSDNFLDSAWYYLRYTSTEHGERPWDVNRLKKWLPVHMYIGGIEHSTMHHLYARFLWKALQDLGHLPKELGPEPFARLRLHGLIIKDGTRMSKSRGNVVNPDEYIAQVGADVLRLYMLFMGPFEVGGDFRDRGINGMVRFAHRVWRVATFEPGRQDGGGPSHGARQDATEGEGAEASARQDAAATEGEGALVREMHQTIRKVSEDMEALAFNTAIAALMGYLNTLQAWQGRASAETWDEAVRVLLLLLAPFAPHLTEELWARRGGAFSIHQQPWPTWDADLAQEEVITLVVQVDGRVRGRITVPAAISAGRAREEALRSEAVRRYLDGREIDRVVFVPGRLINLVMAATEE
ncbi:MAG: leucine--tRNA ligase [Chloroflexi bacterium]|nr:leucine--tRNA ligase [Chloroflexota bacterium]